MPRRSVLLVVPALALFGCLDLFAEQEEGGAGGSGAASQPAGGAGGYGGSGEELCPSGPGRGLGSLHFDGSTSVVAEPQTDRFGVTPFWASAWIQLEEPGGSFPVFGTRRAGSSKGWELRIEAGAPVLRIAVGPGASCTGECGVLFASRALEPDRWTHVGVALKVEVDPTGGRVQVASLYLDGISQGLLVLAPEDDPLPTEWGSFWLGGARCSAGGCFVGLVDEVRVSGAALFDQSYRRELLEPVEGDTRELLALYRLSDEGAVACDASGRDDDATGPSPGSDARILREAGPPEKAWDPRTPFRNEATEAAAGCAEPGGWELVTGVWACRPSLTHRPEEASSLTGPDAAAICAAGYAVCTAPEDRELLGTISFETARSPLGCFAFAAVGAGCGLCPADPSPSDEYTATAGLACGHGDPAGAGCFATGTIDGARAGSGDGDGACLWRGSYSGVLCCSR